MKYVCNFIAALAALLMVSCATSKKMAKDTEQVRVDSVAERVAHVEDVAKMVDTTRNEREQIIITEITFFSPDTTAGTQPPGHHRPKSPLMERARLRAAATSRR